MIQNMNYISIKILRNTFEIPSNFADTESIKAVIKTIDNLAVNGKIQLGTDTFKAGEIKEFIQSLDAEKIVFRDWVELNQDLLLVLKGNLPKHAFQDTHKWLGHTLFSDFQHFLAPYLQESLLALGQNTSQEKLVILFSFTSVLPKDERMFIEQMLFKSIQRKLDESKERIVHAKTENELLAAIQPLCNASVLGIINQLSRSSYATKLAFVDYLLWVIKQNACSVRLANWILKELEKISLNPEHQEKIETLKKDLQHGRLKMKNSLVQARNHWTPSQLISAGLVFLIVTIVIWIVLEKPFSKTIDEPISTATSYEKFTKSERKKIDSLLRQIQQKHAPDEVEIDPNRSILGNGISMALRTPFRNKRMEALYQDLLIDADLHDQGFIDSCAAFPKKTATAHFYKDVKSAKKRNGSIETLFKNVAVYDVYLVVFEDMKKGKVFSTLIKSNETIELKLNSYDHLIFIAGNDLGKFIVPKGASELPSADFDHHFCSTDINYTESLRSIYYLSRPQSGKNKFLISGDMGGYFSVIDLYGVLEVV
jgi:hypothetical protein